MSKILMNNPIVELDGDEMARVLWKWIKEILIEPYVDLKTKYYDLSIKNRDDTDDAITVSAAEAIKEYKVGVKCATITPNKERQKEYNLKKILKSPNATIRKIVGGTVFRTPISIKSIQPTIPGWTNPITVARHSFGDIYASTVLKVERETKVKLLLEKLDGKNEILDVYDYDDDGVFLTQINLDKSIKDFAISCFKYAIEQKNDLIFGTKDTVTGEYDYRFKNIFEEVYESEYKSKFQDIGISYIYTLIDTAIAKIINSNGNIVWACKNYEGDLMSDMVAAGFGSLSLMTSVLMSSDGCYQYDAAHGTVKTHYYKHLKGEKTYTNPVALIFAWANALNKRGELDEIEKLQNFANNLKTATIDTINDGILTKDLLKISASQNQKSVCSETFLKEIKQKLEKI